MDWDNVRKSSDHRPPPAAPLQQRVETCWRMKAPSGKVLTCGVYGHVAQGVEVRCQYEPDDLIRSQFAPEIATARDIAKEWRPAVLAKGFEEIGDREGCDERHGYAGMTDGSG